MLVVTLAVTTIALADGPVLQGDAGTATTAVATQATTGATAAQPGAPQPPGLLGMAMPLLIMFGVLYFLMIRPQQKKVKEHQKLISALAHGDDVVTTSGMLGKITGIADRVVTIEVADNVKVKFLKSQVSQVVKGSIKELAP